MDFFSPLGRIFFSIILLSIARETESQSRKRHSQNWRDRPSARLELSFGGGLRGHPVALSARAAAKPPRPQCRRRVVASSPAAWPPAAGPPHASRHARYRETAAGQRRPRQRRRNAAPGRSRAACLPLPLARAPVLFAAVCHARVLPPCPLPVPHASAPSGPAALARTRAPSRRAALFRARALPRGAPPSTVHACSLLVRRPLPHASAPLQCGAQMHSRALPGGAHSRFARAVGVRPPPRVLAPAVAAPHARPALPSAFSPCSPRACERGAVFLFGWGCGGWVLGDEFWRVGGTNS